MAGKTSKMYGENTDRGKHLLASAPKETLTWKNVATI